MHAFDRQTDRQTDRQRSQRLSALAFHAARKNIYIFYSPENGSIKKKKYKKENQKNTQ